MRKEEPAVGGSEMDYISVQRLPSIAEGRYQKYTRIGGMSRKLRPYTSLRKLRPQADKHGESVLSAILV